MASISRDPRFAETLAYQPPQGAEWARTAGAQWIAAPLTTLIATRWIEDGTAQPILEAQRAEPQARQELALGILPRELLNSDTACMFFWLRVSAPWRSDDFAANALARGVDTMPASAFAVDRSTLEHGVRINLACATSREQLARAESPCAHASGPAARPLWHDPGRPGIFPNGLASMRSPKARCYRACARPRAISSAARGPRAARIGHNVRDVRQRRCTPSGLWWTLHPSA